MNNELEEYIRSCRASGMGDEEIRVSLVEAGWSKEDVNMGLGIGVAVRGYGNVVDDSLSEDRISTPSKAAKTISMVFWLYAAYYFFGSFTSIFLIETINRSLVHTSPGYLGYFEVAQVISWPLMISLTIVMIILFSLFAYAAFKVRAGTKRGLFVAVGTIGLSFLIGIVWFFWAWKEFSSLYS